MRRALQQAVIGSAVFSDRRPSFLFIYQSSTRSGFTLVADFNVAPIGVSGIGPASLFPNFDPPTSFPPPAAYTVSPLQIQYAVRNGSDFLTGTAKVDAVSNVCSGLPPLQLQPGKLLGKCDCGTGDPIDLAKRLDGETTLRFS